MLFHLVAGGVLVWVVVGGGGQLYWTRAAATHKWERASWAPNRGPKLHHISSHLFAACSAGASCVMHQWSSFCFVWWWWWCLKNHNCFNDNGGWWWLWVQPLDGQRLSTQKEAYPHNTLATANTSKWISIWSWHNAPVDKILAGSRLYWALVVWRPKSCWAFLGPHFLRAKDKAAPVLEHRLDDDQIESSTMMLLARQCVLSSCCQNQTRVTAATVAATIMRTGANLSGCVCLSHCMFSFLVHNVTSWSISLDLKSSGAKFECAAFKLLPMACGGCALVDIIATIYDPTHSVSHGFFNSSFVCAKFDTNMKNANYIHLAIKPQRMLLWRLSTWSVNVGVWLWISRNGPCAPGRDVKMVRAPAASIA